MRHIKFTALLFVAALSSFTTACNREPMVATALATSNLIAKQTHQHADARGSELSGPDLAALKRATAPYQVLATANSAGWSTAITPCWYSGTAGGAMGYHYAETARIDSVVEVLKPEALIYEPLQAGKMALVAVEYIVPIAAWTRAERPSLYGRAFDRNDALGLYVMHVWAWRDNPAGVFAAWNAKVSCQYAEKSEDRG